MQEQEEKNSTGNNPSNEKENLSNILHNKTSLPSLRTYQGDVASFIQSKDKSIADLAIKKKEEKMKEEEAKSEQPEAHTTEKSSETVGLSKFYSKEGQEVYRKTSTSPSTSFLISVLSVFLLVGTLSVISYIAYIHFQDEPTDTPSDPLDIIQHQKTISVDSESLTRENLASALKAARSKPAEKGVTAIEIGDPDQKSIRIEDFLSKIAWNMPKPLERNLGDEFMVGLNNNGAKQDFFIIFKVKDYGIAFRDMLIWEDSLFNDFGLFLNYSSNATSTTNQNSRFRDLIVKNKDARSLNLDGKTVLIYTFLNENTVLITESEDSLVALVNAFIAGNTLR